jgi:hypothetical protein
VEGLKKSYQEMQRHYHQAFVDKGAEVAKSMKLEAIVEAQAKRIALLEKPFRTPEKPSSTASPQGAPPTLANMPATGGGMFSPLPPSLSPVVPRVRADRGPLRGRIWTPEGGTGAELTFPPYVGAPFLFFNSAQPVNGVVPATPVQAGSESPGKLLSEAGGQTAGKEEAKGPEVRKEEEGGQSAAAAALAAAVAPAAAAAPAGAAGQSCVPVGSRRPPERPPGQGGTPDAKATRDDEPAGAASPSHWKWKGPEGGPAEGRPEWKQTGSGEWRIVGKGKDKRGLKHTIC